MMNNFTNDLNIENAQTRHITQAEDCGTLASKGTVWGKIFKGPVLHRALVGHCFLLGSISFNVMSHLLLKFGVLQTAAYPGVSTRYLWILLGLAVYALATGCWMACLSCFDLSYAYPFTGLSNVVIFVASWLFFGDNISFQRFGGILLISLGLLFISKGEHRRK